MTKVTAKQPRFDLASNFPVGNGLLNEATGKRRNRATRYTKKPLTVGETTQWSCGISP
jgi:hypothetical protein